jgi:hypothetical protein
VPFGADLDGLKVNAINGLGVLEAGAGGALGVEAFRKGLGFHLILRFAPADPACSCSTPSVESVETERTEIFEIYFCDEGSTLLSKRGEIAASLKHLICRRAMRIMKDASRRREVALHRL